mmetsp:Transcript_58923/g.127439  ORF Transcript_58923/g.127439 Transcript_58923/m.127439 type:complete len:241 (+) Transcript_58923:450-1172(+)
MLDDEVAKGMPAQFLRPFQNLLHERGSLLVRAMLDEALEYPAAVPVPGDGHGIALEFFQHELQLVRRHENNALLQDVICVRRSRRLEDVPSELIYQYSARGAVRHLDGSLCHSTSIKCRGDGPQRRADPVQNRIPLGNSAFCEPGHEALALCIGEGESHDALLAILRRHHDRGLARRCWTLHLHLHHGCGHHLRNRRGHGHLHHEAARARFRIRLEARRARWRELRRRWVEMHRGAHHRV